MSLPGILSLSTVNDCSVNSMSKTVIPTFTNITKVSPFPLWNLIFKTNWKNQIGSHETNTFLRSSSRFSMVSLLVSTISCKADFHFLWENGCCLNRCHLPWRLFWSCYGKACAFPKKIQGAVSNFNFNPISNSEWNVTFSAWNFLKYHASYQIFSHLIIISWFMTSTFDGVSEIFTPLGQGLAGAVDDKLLC